MKRYRWIRWVLFIGLVALVTTGCSNNETMPIDPPQTHSQMDKEMIEQTISLLEEEQQAEMEVSLFFKDHHGYVVPVSMNVPSAEYIAKLTLQYMTVNGLGKDSIPAGFSALIPEGTTIKGLNIISDKKLAIVDFSKEFTNYDEQDERKILEAITWALTNYSTIDQVELWVEGQKLKQMPKNGTPLDEPLSRNMGINIEQSDVVNLGQTTPVTLYFQSLTADNQSYFVPVTRMIRRTDDVARSALEQLVKGPMASTHLAPVIVPNVEVLQIYRADDVINVHLSDQVLDSDYKVPTDTLKSVILSLTESTDASKVKIMVNGDIQVNSTDNQNFSIPVARPTHLNQIVM